MKSLTPHPPHCITGGSVLSFEAPRTFQTWQSAPPETVFVAESTASSITFGDQYRNTHNIISFKHGTHHSST